MTELKNKLAESDQPVKKQNGGARPGAGRPLGSMNKYNATIRDMVLKALNMAGGEKYLLKQAKDNPVAFLGLVAKVMPMQVQGDVTHKFVARVPEIEKTYDAWQARFTQTIEAPILIEHDANQR